MSGFPGTRDPHRAGLARGSLLAVLALLIVALAIWPASEPVREPTLELVALGPDGRFTDSLAVPATWGDTATRAGGVIRVPLVLAVRNTGRAPGRPEHLDLGVPTDYRLDSPDGIEGVVEAGSPLIAYTLETGLAAVEPGRLPALLPDHDTLWLEVLVPTYHCVVLADSVPELIPAHRPVPATLADVRIFYSLEGGDLPRRRTGTLVVALDTTLLDLPGTPQPPSFPVAVDSGLANPETGPLRLLGSRRIECGDAPGAGLRSTVWATAGDGRVFELEVAGALRKRLYDLDGDGVIERESWDPDGGGTLEATRRTRLRPPGFLLPPGETPDPGPGPG
ncbi:MAG: hypothetical protein ACOCUW_03640 [Gemmatimonadota bacterium]